MHDKSIKIHDNIFTDLENTSSWGGMGGGLLSLPSLTLSSCRVRFLYQVLSTAGCGISMIGLIIKKVLINI